MEINIGGKVFRITANQLDRLPASKLTVLYRNGSKSCSENRSSLLYFDRDPESFSCILSAYSGCKPSTNTLLNKLKRECIVGLVHAPKSVCPIQLKEEMMFWYIDESLLDVCCNERLEAALNIIEQNETNMAEQMQRYSIKQQKIQLLTKINSWEDFRNNWNAMRFRLWSVAEDPSSSVLAKLWMLASITFILISLAVFVLGTVEGYFIKDENGIEHEIAILSDIETVCMIWFTLEYTTRFIVSPKKWTFIRQILNIIDLLSIIPFFIEMFSHTSETFGTLDTWIHMTQLLRILRIVRVFRLGRHSEGLKLLCLTLFQSANELIMLSIYLFIGIIMLATSLYTLEGNLFSNLCDALWFSAVTITTVGYGKIVASMSFLMGIIAIAIPIHPIITNFSHCYRTNKDIELAFKRSLQIMRLDGFPNNNDKNEKFANESITSRGTDKGLHKKHSIGLNKTSVTKLASSIASVSELLHTRHTCQHEHCPCVFCSD